MRGLRELPVWAWLVLGAFPVLALLLPMALGHPPVLGDNATQNISLRWLASRDELSGHLPAWDPFNWDGTPLLAGFNAGALFPLIVLFWILPANWAMALTLAAVWFATELALLGIGRMVGLSTVPRVFAAVTFCDMGAFVGQVVHVDMLEGDLGSAVAIYFLLRLLGAEDGSARVRAAGGLAVGYACAILAGAPEAMLASLVALGGILLVRLARREVPLRTLVLVAMSALVALGLAAAQWVPGLAYASISTRAHLPANYAGVGPFGPIFFPLLALPFAYGGPAGGYLPSYFGNYNANEVNVAIGSAALLLVVVALTARRLSRVQPWARATLVVVGGLGLLLALGSYTPVAQLVYHLPLFQLQRLASRYLVDVDLALALLAGLGLEVSLERWRRRQPLPPASRMGVVLVTVVVAVGAVALAAAPRVLLPHLRVVSIPSGPGLLQWRLYLIGQAAIVVTAGYALVARGARLSWRRILLVTGMVLDIGLAATQFVDLPAFYQPHGNPALPGVQALLPREGSYGIYDPDLYLYNRTIAADEQFDRNVFLGLHSIQGYASLSLASYNRLTGTKPESTLEPRLLDFYHEALDLDVVITSRRYLHIAVAAPMPTVRLPHLLLAEQASTGFFVGDIPDPVRLEVPLVAGRAVATLHFIGEPAVSVRLHPTGAFLQARVPPGSGVLSWMTIRLASQPHGRLPVFVRAGDQWLLVAGPLVNQALPAVWRSVQGRYSTVDLVARAPVTGILRAPPGVAVADVEQARDGTVHAIISSHDGLVMPTTLAWAPGWHATGARIVDEGGLIGLALGSGRHAVSLSYRVPGLRLGVLLSLVAAAVLVVGLGGVAPVVARRRDILRS